MACCTAAMASPWAAMPAAVLKLMRGRRELALMARRRAVRCRGRGCTTLSSGTWVPLAATDEDAAQHGGVGLQPRVDFLDDAILVALGVDDGDLPLREGVVERAVDGGDRDAEAGGGGAVDHHVGLRTGAVLVAGDVGDAGQGRCK